MMEQTNLVPKRRFKQFQNTQAWKQRKFNDLIQKLTGGASIKPDDYQESGVRTIPKGAVNSSGVADLLGSKHITYNFFEKNISSKVSTGDLVTSLRDLVPTAPNMGRIVRIKGKKEDFLMPQGVYRIELQNNVDEDFMIAFSNSDKYREIISAEKNGSTQVHLRNGEFLNIEIHTPNYEEQTKIGIFFKQLDSTIALHQRKLEKTKALKSAYLSEMFPSEGERVPKRRFVGFTQAWEQRKLKDLADFSKGNGYSKSDLTDEGKPVILYGRLYTKYETVIEFVDTFTIEKENSVISKGNEVIVPASGETSEDISRASAVSKPGIILGGDLNIIRPSNEIDPVFLALTISNGKQQKELSKRAQGKSVVHLHNSDLKEVNLLFPTKEEQTKIGEFFKQLDDTIALYQRKLEKLQNIKKAYLNEMFV